MVHIPAPMGLQQQKGTMLIFNMARVLMLLSLYMRLNLISYGLEGVEVIIECGSCIAVPEIQVIPAIDVVVTLIDQDVFAQPRPLSYLWWQVSVPVEISSVIPDFIVVLLTVQLT